MSWITITRNNLANYQAGKLVEAMQMKAKLDGQEEPVSAACRMVIAKIRAAIANGGYRLSENQNAIPPELEADALALVVFIAKPRLTMELKPDERTAATNAEAKLSLIAEGKIDVSSPDSASNAIQSSGGCALVRPARGTPQRSDYNGL